MRKGRPGVAAWRTGDRSVVDLRTIIVRPEGAPAPGLSCRRTAEPGDGRDQAATLRAGLSTARENLAHAQSQSEELAHQRDAALADAERWKLQALSTQQAHDHIAARRDALTAALPGALSAMLSTACSDAWEEGWRAGRAGGVVSTQNPYRADLDLAPGSPTQARVRCRAYLRQHAEQRSAARPRPGSP